MIGDIHRRFLEAGADIIETNTFSATSIGQSEFFVDDPREHGGRKDAAFYQKILEDKFLDELAWEINEQSARQCREWADRVANKDSRQRFVAGAIGRALVPGDAFRSFSGWQSWLISTMLGLIGSLATFGRVNAFGFVETPYRKVTDGEVTDQVDYLTADEEDKHVIAQANALDASGAFAAAKVLVRKKGGEVDYLDPSAVDYIDVSPRQICSVATAMIPFLEHDDANRALMGSNMMRQAVPLLRSEAPLVGTGMEHRAAVDAGDVVINEHAGVVEELSADYVTVMADDGTRRTYRLSKFRRSNQGTCINQKPIVAEGDRVEQGQVIADGPCTDDAEMALGKNLLVAFMPWEGHNYEDAIILSQRLVQDDILVGDRGGVRSGHHQKELVPEAVLVEPAREGEVALPFVTVVEAGDAVGQLLVQLLDGFAAGQVGGVALTSPGAQRG